MARKYSPAQKQRRTIDDPRARRPKRRNLGLDASGGGWRARAGGAERHRRREIAEPSASRGAGSLRAGLSGGSNQSLWRQHIPNRGVHRHGALRAASKAEVSRGRIEGTLMDRSLLLSPVMVPGMGSSTVTLTLYFVL